MPHDKNGKFKGYEAVAQIGGGGFSEVYSATQTSIGREVVIKVIRPDRANQPDFIRRFETEAQIVARLEHPHITPLIDFWRDPQGAYLVMRYLRGGSIFDTIKKQGAIDAATTSHMLEQIAAALDFAHRNEVIHRDIKPGNILLDEDGNAYIADFGIAKDLTVVDPDSQTNPEHIVGSLDYIAPEQARGEPVTPRTDIYSLGVTLYEMLTGKHPFENDNPVQRLFKHLTDPLPALEGLPDDVQATLNDIIQKATAKDPAKRYPDVIALAIAFREAVQARPVEGLTPREIDILILLAERKSNHEIAQELFLSYETVRWHLGNIYKKLGVPNRSQAVKRARELGWLGADDLGDGTVVLTGEFSLVEPDNPYKGLRSFNIEDARDFFGREKAVEKLLQRMTEGSRFERFLAIVGPSGSGKSSLVKAGLHPALRNGSLSGSDKWFYVSLKPQNRPLDELEIALTKLAANQGQNMRQHLERDERGLVRAAELLLPDDGSELFIIIDQFEEVFTLVEDEAERQHFLNLLLSAASDARSRVRLVVTLRADYYDKPLHYPEFGEMLRTRMETILPLTATGLEQAIVRPAQRVGVNFEPGLVAQIVSEINYQAGALPLLQYALTELFEQRQGRLLTLEAYQRIGGVVGALAKGADNIYNGFDSAAQQLTKQIFLRLVTLGEGAEDTRRRTTLDELFSIATPPLYSSVRNELAAMESGLGGEVNDLLSEILESFAQSRLVTLGHDDGTRQPTVEVAHEAILREWATLREWLNDSRDDIRQQRIVAQAAEAWQANRRDTSYLLSGTRLEQAEKWHQSTELALTPLERDFIEASIAERASRQKAESERQAREMRLEQRSRNFLRGLVAVLLLATLGAFGLTSLAIRNANEAQANFRTSERIRFAAQAQIALERGDATELPALLALRSLQLAYSPEADSALLQALSRGFARQIYIGHTDEVNCVAFSPDGRFVASASSDDTVRLWDTQSGQEIRRFTGHTNNVISIAFSSDGTTLISSGTDYTIRFWDVATGAEINQFRYDDNFRLAIPSPDNRYILQGFADETARLLDSQTGAVIREFVGHSDSVVYADFSSDNRYVLTVSNDRTARLWDVATGQQLREFVGHTDALYGGEIAPNGQFVITSSSDNTARVWNIMTGNEIQRLVGHTDLVFDARISPDNRFALTTSSDKTARLWDIATGRELRQFVGHTSRIGPGHFSPDGQYVLTGSSDRTVRLWDVAPVTQPRVFVRPTLAFLTQPLLVDVSEDILTIISLDSLLVKRNAETGEVLQEIPLGIGIINDAALSPNQQLAATVNGDGLLALWNTQTGKEIFQISAHTAPINRVRFSPDGQAILTASDDQTAKLWNLQGELLQGFSGHEDILWGIAFAPDGTQILTGSSDQTARLWNIETGEQIQQFNGHSGIIRSVDFSPNGEQIVTGGNDRTARLWDVQSGRELQRFTGHTDEIASVKFSPDGQSILTGSVDQTARIWDIRTGQVARQFIGHAGVVFIARFSDDGQFVVTSDTGKVYHWRANLTELVEFTCLQLHRDFTDEERVLYNIMDNQPTCSQLEDSAQTALVEPTWTAVPPQPTPNWTPIPLEPVSEIIEFTFLGNLQSYENFAMPASDVYQADGNDFVSRIPNLDEITRQIPLYSANERVPGDMTPPYDMGPWSQGTPLGFTLGDWVSAEGHGTYTVQRGGARLDVVFDHLIPNGVYTLWCNEVTLIPQLSLEQELPCGKADGSESVFIADANGHAEFSTAVNILPPFTDDHVLDIAVVYHSDGQTYGVRLGEQGMNAHGQLWYDFLPPGS